MANNVPNEPEPRSFRVDPKLWRRFGDICEAKYTNRTEQLNRFIAHYVHKAEMEQGYFTDEMKEAVTRTLRKQSVLLLQELLENLLTDAATSDEIDMATDLSGESIKELFE